MLNALLIQLFGRDVTDRIVEAGFSTTEAIASSGAGAIAHRAGIPLPLARRIVVVAAETGPAPGVRSPAGGRGPAAELLEEPSPGAGPAAAERPTTTARRQAPAPRARQEPEPSTRAERHVRRPFRRPHSALAAASDAPSGGRSAVEPGKGPEGSDAPERGRPFVDDARLVSWMGLASRAGKGPGMPISVSEEILKTEPQGSRESTAAPRRPPPDSIAKPATAAPRPRSDDAPGGRRALVPGSFWSFGASPGAPKKPAARPPGDPTRETKRNGPGAQSTACAPPGTSGRRSDDGH